uniref:Reverse transcriptase/retrotransposon-derived protein RNase H-like domain-containing protein n=1 Tax=Fagus sylvatica TaxID=28930 RepID=A0A2N9I6W9_FAGSY
MIGKTMEVYINDMQIKSLRKENHIDNLTRVFGILQKDRLWLNASKCTFGVNLGKFVGHIVSRRGIEANPNQIAALIDLAEPRDAKQVQHLTRMVAALGRFFSRSADRCRPFFRLLGRKRKFLWDDECSVAFQDIKSYLSSTPCLSIPTPGEPLFLYFAVSNHAVSVVLVQQERLEQKPIFFVSKVMDETELRYLPLEKAALALLQETKKLPHYFQESTVTVLIDLFLRMLLQRSDFSRRITKLGVQLGSFDIEYKPRTAIKRQARDERMSAYLQVVRSLLAEFESTQVAQIGREHNSHADVLAKLAMALEYDMQRTICVETLDCPSF